MINDFLVSLWEKFWQWRADVHFYKGLRDYPRYSEKYFRELEKYHQCIAIKFGDIK